MSDEQQEKEAGEFGANLLQRLDSCTVIRGPYDGVLILTEVNGDSKSTCRLLESDIDAMKQRFVDSRGGGGQQCPLKAG